MPTQAPVRPQRLYIRPGHPLTALTPCPLPPRTRWAAPCPMRGEIAPLRPCGCGAGPGCLKRWSPTLPTPLRCTRSPLRQRPRSRPKPPRLKPTSGRPRRLPRSQPGSAWPRTPEEPSGARRRGCGGPETAEDTCNGGRTTVQPSSGSNILARPRAATLWSTASAMPSPAPWPGSAGPLCMPRRFAPLLMLPTPVACSSLGPRAAENRHSPQASCNAGGSA